MEYSALHRETAILASENALDLRRIMPAGYWYVVTSREYG